MAEGSGCILPHASRAVSVGGSLRAALERSAAEGLMGASRWKRRAIKTHAETIAAVVWTRYRLLFDDCYCEWWHPMPAMRPSAHIDFAHTSPWASFTEDQVTRQNHNSLATFRDPLSNGACYLLARPPDYSTSILCTEATSPCGHDAYSVASQQPLSRLDSKYLLASTALVPPPTSPLLQPAVPM